MAGDNNGGDNENTPAVNPYVVGLKPPEILTNLTMEGYIKWKKRFEIYRIASGNDKASEEVQQATLLHCMGEQCIDIYSTFDFETQTKSYARIIKKFDDYFVPAENESVSSHVFFTRDQLQDESFDAYLTDLRKLSVDCEFGELKDRLIRDRIVAGIHDKTLKNRWLRESDLTLTKTITICKAAERAGAQIKKIENPSEIAVLKKNNNVRKVEYQNKRGAQRRQQYGHHQNSRDKEEDSSCHHQQQQPAYRGKEQTAASSPDSCGRCGYVHQWKKCPAYGKTCGSCGKLNHFKKMCKKKCTNKSCKL